MIAYAVTVAIGFSRVFVDWDFLARPRPHRRRRPRRLLPDPPAAPPAVRRHPARARRAHLAGGVDVLPGHVHRRVPARRHVGDRARRLPLVRDDFQSTTPPVEYVGGWAFLAGATMAATVWLADTFAFRAQARGEALVPGRRAVRLRRRPRRRRAAHASPAWPSSAPASAPSPCCASASNADRVPSSADRCTRS